MKMLDVPQSGSIAGQTSSRNRFGQYRRTRAIPVNPNTSAQVAVRGYLTTASQAWKTLDPADVDGWNAYATTHGVLDSLGQTIYLTGHQWFVKVNTALAAAGLSQVTAPPGNIAIAVPQVTIVDETVAAFEITSATDYSGADVTVQVFCSPPMSPGTAFNGDYRLVATVATPGPGDTLVSEAELVAKWGTLAAGMKFYLRFTGVSEASGIGGSTDLSSVLT